MTVYVISRTGKPLMPTARCGRVRILLKRKLAKPVNNNPFTIQLLYDTPEIVQNLTLGIDPGRTNIGLCAVTDNNEPVFSAQVITRNKDIPKRMSERKAFRQKHRQYKRRKKRQRRAAANGTVLKTGSIERHLPGYGENKTITCKSIRNKETRFNNRKRKPGWLTPTANQLLQTHVNTVKKLMKFLPISNIRIELNRFAFMRLDDPSVHGRLFQEGPLKGYDGDVKQAVYDLQDGKCVLCGEPIEEYHHVVCRSKNGSETVRNRVGLCGDCHHAVHTDDSISKYLAKTVKGLYKRYDAIGVLNQIIPVLITSLNRVAPLEIVSGWETKRYRDSHHLKKEHYVDAYCIACSGRTLDTVQSPDNCYIIRQFRRHDRQCCKKEMLNRNYMLDGKTIATNRSRAFEQKSKSLDEYVSEGGRTDNLTVKEHKPVMKDMKRIRPGSILIHDRKLKVVMKRAEGRYYFTDESYVPIKKAVLYHNNAGLAFVSNTQLRQRRTQT